MISICFILSLLFIPVFLKYNWFLLLYTSVYIPLNIVVITHYLQRSQIVQESSIEIRIISENHLQKSAFIYWSVTKENDLIKQWLEIENTGTSTITSIYLMFNRTKKQKETCYEIYHSVKPGEHLLFAIPDTVWESGIHNLTIIYYANAIDCSSQFCGNLQKFRNYYYFPEIKEAKQIKWKKVNIIECRRNTYLPKKITLRIIKKALKE